MIVRCLIKHDEEAGKQNLNCLQAALNWTATSFKCFHILQMKQFSDITLYLMQWRQELAMWFSVVSYRQQHSGHLWAKVGTLSFTYSYKAFANGCL